MVFDLKEPGLYAMDSRSDGLVVSFFPSATTGPVAAAPAAALVQPTPPPAPAPVPAPKKEEPKVEPKAEPKTVTTEAPCPTREVEPPAQELAVVAEGQQEKFKPKTIVGDEEKYSGDIISLKIKDSDLKDVVLYLAEFAGLNVVFDPDVRGTVTVNLQDVPWDQALEMILKQNKMGKTIEGNILRIAPISVLTREEEEQRRLKESKELSGPVMVKTITLSYSKAKDVASLLRSKISERGEIIVDDRTNTLLISEVRDKLELLEKLITVVDTPTPQVSIEARVVEASATFVRNLGIQWGFRGVASPYYGNATNLQFPNSVLVDGAMIPQGIVTKGIGGPLGGYAVNLPAPSFNSAIGFSFANVLDSFRVDIALSALETGGDGKIISRPSVVTPEQPAGRDHPGPPDPRPDRGQLHRDDPVRQRGPRAAGDAADHGRGHDHHDHRDPEQRRRLRQPGQRHPADHDAERQDDGHGPRRRHDGHRRHLPHGGLGHARARALPPPDPDPGQHLQELRPDEDEPGAADLHHAQDHQVRGANAP